MIFSIYQWPVYIWKIAQSYNPPEKCKLDLQLYFTSFHVQMYIAKRKNATKAVEKMSRTETLHTSGGNIKYSVHYGFKWEISKKNQKSTTWHSFTFQGIHLKYSKSV